MWTGVDCDGGPTAMSVEDLLSFWVSSTELVEDTDMGSHQAVGAGEPQVMAFSSSRAAKLWYPDRD